MANLKRGPKKKFKPTKTIFVDVDGTVWRNGILDHKLVEWCRARMKEGFTFILWSARGEMYARVVAERFGITDIFKYIISKPEQVIDDQGWAWVKYTKVIRKI